MHSRESGMQNINAKKERKKKDLGVPIINSYENQVFVN